MPTQVGRKHEGQSAWYGPVGAGDKDGGWADVLWLQ